MGTTEVTQWINWKEFREHQALFKNPYTETKKEDGRSWHIESFTIHIGQLDLTLKSHIPEGK